MFLDATPSQVPAIIENARFFATVGAAFWAAFSGYSWVKNSLTATQEGVHKLTTEVSAQTTAIVHATQENTAQVRELRDDVKTMIQAFMQPPVRSRAARRKK